MKKEMYMEDISSISLRSTETIYNELHKFKLKEDEGEQNQFIEDVIEDIYNYIFEKLETICPNDYKNHL